MRKVVKRVLGGAALLVALAVLHQQTHVYGMPWQAPAGNSGVVVDMGGGYCAGVELRGVPGLFGRLPLVGGDGGVCG